MAQGSLGRHDIGTFASVLVKGTNPSRRDPVLEGLSEGICLIC